MKYKKVIPARFISRPNRFIANCLVDGEEVVCHVKNTGRCRELLVPDAAVWLSDERDNKERKTPFDLICVQKGELLINMDSQAPNKAAGELLSRLYPSAEIFAEKTFGESRIDFYIENGEEKRLVEVKGVTLENDGVAAFPDAPTQRGIKHLETLGKYIELGYKATVLFIIQMKGIHLFVPNVKTHPQFAAALKTVADKGVEVLAYDCIVTPDTMIADKPVKVEI